MLKILYLTLFYLRLNSKYNKKGGEKRSPEDFLKGERNYYCPCDDFDLFDQFYDKKI